MKIKSDFVTNSSSTSFIVFWPVLVSKKEDVSKYIKRKDFQDVIFNDIKGQTALKVSPTEANTIQRMVSIIEHGYIPEYDKYERDDVFCREHDITMDELRDNQYWQDQMYKHFDNIRKRFAMEKASELAKQYEGHYVYIFEYGNEVGAGVLTEIEYENNWGGLPHFSISNH